MRSGVVEREPAKDNFAWGRALREPDHGLSPRLHRAALVFATYVGKDGRAFPRQADLAAALGIHRQAANVIVRDLVALGWLEVEHRERRGRSNVYRVTIPVRLEASAGSVPAAPVSRPVVVREALRVVDEPVRESVVLSREETALSDVKAGGEVNSWEPGFLAYLLRLVEDAFERGYSRESVRLAMLKRWSALGEDDYLEALERYDELSRGSSVVAEAEAVTAAAAAAA